MGKFSAKDLESKNHSILKEKVETRGRKKLPDNERLTQQTMISWTQAEYKQLLDIQAKRSKALGMKIPLTQVVKSLCKSKDFIKD